MPRKKGVRVTLLVEDEMTERFAREVLLKLGYHRGELLVIAYPVGRGSNKQWVNQQYPRQVSVHRSKRQFQKLALLVGTDADEHSVTQRKQQLAESLNVLSMTSVARGIKKRSRHFRR